MSVAVDEQRRTRRPGIDAVLTAALTGATLLLLATLLWRWGDLQAAMESTADLAAPLALGDQAHAYPDAYVMTGNYGWWPGLWTVQLLRTLPAGGWLGAHAPGALSLLSIVALALAAGRLWRGRSALVVGLVALSTGPAALTFSFAWSGRAPTWWAMILLGIATVHMVSSTPRPRWTTWLFTAVAVLIAAIVLSGDRLALTTSIVPLAAVAVLLGWRRQLRAALVPAAMALVVGAGSIVVRAAAEAAGYLQQDYPIERMSFAEYGSAAVNALAGLMQVWRGAGGGDVDAAVSYAGVLLVVVALLSGGAWIGREILQRRGAPMARVGSAAASDDEDEVRLAHQTWMTFWFAALVAMLLAYVASRNAIENGVPVPRYLYGVPVATAAVLAVVVARPAGRWVAGLAAAAGVAAALAALRTAPPVTPAGHTAIASRVARIASEQQLARGYGPYWSAYPIQVASGDRVEMVPIGGCPDIEPYTLCPMYLHYIDKAYVPQSGDSFVLIDPSGSPPGPHWEWLTQLPPDFRPRSTIDVGEGVTMAIFDGDVASRLQLPVRSGPPPGSGGPLVGASD